MTIQDLGSIGEFVAAAATVATLVYLAVQIRQNTLSMRASDYQDAVRSANEWGALFVHHPETVAIFRKGLARPDSLDPGEDSEFTHFLEALLRNYAAARLLAGEGQIPTSVCDSYEHSLRYWFSSPEIREWWKGRTSPYHYAIIDSLFAA